MRVNHVVILIVVAVLTGVYLFAQESQEASWTMFQSGNSPTFLYNRNTGAVYKFYVSGEGDDFTYGFQRASILNRSDVEIPSAF